jgi:hypothetical protein
MIRRRLKILFAVSSLLFAAIQLLAAPAAWATHEADHRYAVRGYVLDDSQQPVAGASVSIRLAGRSVGFATTDGEGFYSVDMHLHDSDIGKRLVVRAGESQANILMQATPGDHATHRVHHVNFVAGELIEDEFGKGPFPVWVYPVAAAALILFVVPLIVRAKKRAVKHRQALERTAEPGRRRKRKKKRKR